MKAQHGDIFEICACCSRRSARRKTRARSIVRPFRCGPSHAHFRIRTCLRVGFGGWSSFYPKPTRRKEAKRRHPHPDIASSSVCEKIVLSEAAFPCLRSASGIITNSEGDALASGGCSPNSRLSLPLATHKIRAWGTQCARETECLQCRLDTGQCQSDRWRRDDGQCSALSQNALTCELKIRSHQI